MLLFKRPIRWAGSTNNIRHSPAGTRCQPAKGWRLLAACSSFLLVLNRNFRQDSAPPVRL